MIGTDENRTLVLDDADKMALWQFAEGDQMAPTVDEVWEMLPPKLSLQEVSTIGLAISAYAERINPSRNGYSHGRKAEDSVTFAIGSAAVVCGDTVTAESAIAHMKRDKLAPMRYLGGVMLSCELKKRRR